MIIAQLGSFCPAEILSNSKLLRGAGGVFSQCRHRLPKIEIDIRQAMPALHALNTKCITAAGLLACAWPHTDRQPEPYILYAFSPSGFCKTHPLPPLNRGEL
ncbi:MAG: hypothetical protein HCAMLNBO_02779 [Candidatus Brocadia fulgida]|nr:hypothetical protein [Candidatus Brocadia fulgida]